MLTEILNDSCSQAKSATCARCRDAMQRCQCALRTGCTCRLLQSSMPLSRHTTFSHERFCISQVPATPTLSNHQHDVRRSTESAATQSLLRLQFWPATATATALACVYAGHPGKVSVQNYLSRLAAIRDVTHPGP